MRSAKTQESSSNASSDPRVNECRREPPQVCELRRTARGLHVDGSRIGVSGASQDRPLRKERIDCSVRVVGLVAQREIGPRRKKCEGERPEPGASSTIYRPAPATMRSGHRVGTGTAFGPIAGQLARAMPLPGATPCRRLPTGTRTRRSICRSVDFGWSSCPRPCDRRPT